MNELAPRPSQQDWPLYGLVSLLDIMKRFSLRSIATLAEVQMSTRTILTFESNRPQLGDQVYSSNSLVGHLERALMPEAPKPIGKDLARSLAGDFKRLCKLMGLTLSEKNLERFTPETDRELAMMWNMVLNELDSFLYVYISPDKANFWESDDILSQKTKDAFSGSVSTELRLAGTAYACDLGTASVFHSMRAAEVGIRMIATDLGVSLNGDEQLKVAIDGIQAAARKLDEVKRHPNKSSDSQFYSELAIDAGLMKDAWRNHVSHAKASYTGNQAKTILDAACRFFEKLSERFNQNSAAKSSSQLSEPSS